MDQPTRVAVLGCGIIGLSSALHIIETRSDVRVTIVADKFSPDTTSDIAAGFLKPHLLEGLSDDTIKYWCQETIDYLLNLYLSQDAASCGVGLLSSYEVFKDPVEKPPYADIFLNWRLTTKKELNMFPEEFKYGMFYTTMYAECAKLLPYMLSKFQEKGGKLIRRKINAFSEFLGHYDVLVNCPGLGAISLANDSQVRPIRGQTIRVYAPWIKHAIIGDGFHILPNNEVAVCGGTRQVDNWSLTVDPTDRDYIWNGCCRLCPSLKEAKVIREVVGLRPKRFKPRIEKETYTNRIGQSLEIIHNYGHGGSGVTLFWGCAKEVSKLLDESIAWQRKRHLRSAL